MKLAAVSGSLSLSILICKWWTLQHFQYICVTELVLNVFLQKSLSKCFRFTCFHHCPIYAIACIHLILACLTERYWMLSGDITQQTQETVKDRGCLMEYTEVSSVRKTFNKGVCFKCFSKANEAYQSDAKSIFFFYNQSFL